MMMEVSAGSRCFGLLLLPNYAMEGVSAVIDILANANELTGIKHYSWQLIAIDGEEVVSDSGLAFQQQTSIETADLDSFDVLVVCGGSVWECLDVPSLNAWLAKVGARNKQIGSIGSASSLLAENGLLDGYRCSLDIRQVVQARDSFPAIDVNDRLFTIDGERFSCIGGSSVIDMMLNLLIDDVGFELVAKVADILGCERIRSPVDAQPHRGAKVVPGDSVLTNAIAIMRNNIDEPISITEIAQYMERSPRQIERLFKKHLGCKPSRYYMNLRLNHARHLLLSTGEYIQDIGKSCGFMSSTHFSKCFRDQHGLTPSEIRSGRDHLDRAPCYLLNQGASTASYLGDHAAA